MNKIRKGDEVIVIAGRDKGKRGKIIINLADLQAWRGDHALWCSRGTGSGGGITAPLPPAAFDGARTGGPRLLVNRIAVAQGGRHPPRIARQGPSRPPRIGNARPHR